MKNFCSFLAACVFIVTLSACTEYSGNNKQDLSNSLNNKTIADKYAKLRLGDEYILYNEPSPEMLGDYGVVKASEGIEIIETTEQWVQIKQGNQTGWIPSWYISEAITEPVRDIKQKNSVLKYDTGGYLTPQGRLIIELEKGRLVKPIKEWQNWYQIRILVYDIPAVQVAWIEKDCLTNPETLFPKEGYLKKGTVVYEVSEFEEIRKTASEATKYDMAVFYDREKNGYIQVCSNGGWSAWTKKEYLVFHEDDELPSVTETII